VGGDDAAAQARKARLEAAEAAAAQAAEAAQAVAAVAKTAVKAVAALRAEIEDEEEAEAEESGGSQQPRNRHRHPSPSPPRRHERRGRSPTVQIYREIRGRWPMLTRSNYYEWNLLMKVKLQARFLWNAIKFNNVDYVQDRASFGMPSSLMMSTTSRIAGC